MMNSWTKEAGEYEIHAYRAGNQMIVLRITHRASANIAAYRLDLPHTIAAELGAALVGLAKDPDVG